VYCFHESAFVGYFSRCATFVIIFTSVMIFNFVVIDDL